jgi:hypothetical protein
VIRDAHERGAKVSRRTDGQYLIDELPVILDARLDIRDSYVMSYSGAKFGTDGDFTIASPSSYRKELSGTSRR